MPSNKLKVAPSHIGREQLQYSNEVNRRSAFFNQSLCNELVLSNYVLNTQSKIVASIWLEIWRVVDPGKRISIFPGKFPKNFDFSRNFTHKKSISRQIS